MKKNAAFFLAITALAVLSSCKKDQDPVINITNSASGGSEHVQFQGIAGTEPGSVAGNSVYLDLSTEKMTTALRSGWDLGLYSSNSDFRVIINNTSVAGAKATSKFDINAVGTADTVGYAAAGITLSTSQTNPLPADLAYFDNIGGDINQTVIPAVSATDAANPVIILNRGTGGAIAPRTWMKIRVLRNGTGYTVQYANLQETTFHTISVAKNDSYNFQFISFDSGAPVSVEPEKLKWDLVWTYSVYQTNFGAGTVPYNFSDLIAVNHLAGVQVKEKIYADANTANAAYTAFNRDSVNAASNATVSGRWTIGSAWRSTQPATGARADRFYLIKDANGNYYKFKCIAMGVGSDGGTRGKPEFKYSLIP